MQIAISQLIAPAGLSIPEFAALAQNAGYEGVELSLRPKNSPFNYDVTDADLAGFRQACADNAQPIHSITISTNGGNFLATGEAAKVAMEQTVFGLECAAKLGAKVALHTLGGFSADLYYEDAYNNAIDNLKKLAPFAEKIGVDLAIEFVWNGFLFSPLEMRNLIDTIGSKAIGFYFDPGNMAVFQFPQHWVRALGHRVKHVHLKDWKGNALNGQWTPLLQGACNFPVIMAELHKAGYQGPLVSEVSPSLASFEDTARTMRTIAEM